MLLLAAAQNLFKVPVFYSTSITIGSEVLFRREKYECVCEMPCGGEVGFLALNYVCFA
jgi:hypothetical protein